MAGKRATSIVFKFFFFFYLGVALLSFLSNYSDLIFDDENQVERADGFTIESYNVVLDVEENNKVDVTENVTVAWYEEGHHGIYKFTPEWLKYTSKDGRTIQRKSVVSNYRAEGEEYSLDVVKKKQRIKIGSAAYTLERGNKDYVIKYTYDMGKDPYKGFDEFIFHAFGDYWGTEIKNPSIQVNMPKSIEGYNVNFFMDKKRETNINEFMDYKVSGKTLTATFNSDKYYHKQYIEYCDNPYNLNEYGECDEQMFNYEFRPLEKAITVDIELPENYFVGGSWNYGYGSIIITVVIIGLTIITIIKWRKYGKDFEKRAMTVEFYPPDGLSSAEIGYVHGNKSNKKLTISLIIQLASKGYIKIDELKDKKKQIQITNLAIKPEEVKPFDETLPKRIIEIERLKTAGSDLTLKENTMLKYLFKNGDRKLLDANINKFLEVKDALVNKGYIKIIQDTGDNVNATLEERKKEYDKVVAQYNKDMEKYLKDTKNLDSLTELEKKIYDRLFSEGNVVILSEHRTFYLAFDDVHSYLNSTFKHKIHDQVASSKVAGAIFRGIIILVLSVISYRVVEDLDPRFGFVYNIAFICNFVNLFFVFVMKRKTEYGEDIKARVKGFRNFLETAEKERLESLVLEHPSYFYDILPYTYVLGLSKKWIKKFEDIPLPETDMGSFDYGNDVSYHSLYSDIYYPVSSSSSSGSSSGCSSCGGGCSSCGGGCSSCGGGGSW